eukprot:CAMPEP_0184010364 /NCGR_PEP_ID=MMETSP0954-20121128/3167_1 /TAXON_ID=627963 /ORGANISM="Aplanochytrium sp, Strain PBS07" /LENGTH=102 /DNA_ID=CAMNT_0026289935 /DNA_START=313 /DNA_END=617 /DNA_ORIENTATION=+
MFMLGYAEDEVIKERSHGRRRSLTLSGTEHDDTGESRASESKSRQAIYYEDFNAGDLSFFHSDKAVAARLDNLRRAAVLNFDYDRSKLDALALMLRAGVSVG